MLKFTVGRQLELIEVLENIMNEYFVLFDFDLCVGGVSRGNNSAFDNGVRSRIPAAVVAKMRINSCSSACGAIYLILLKRNSKNTTRKNARFFGKLQMFFKCLG